MLAIETLEQGVKYVQRINKDTRRHLRRSGILIDSFEHFSHLVFAFLLLTLKI